MFKKKVSCLFLLFMIAAFSCVSQSNSSKFEAGAGFAAFVYQGDLTPDRFGSFVTTRPGVYLTAAKILGPAFMIRVNISFGSLRGDETKYDNPEYRKFRALKFRTPVAELSPQLVWHPLIKNNSTIGISPYLFGGAALAWFNVNRDYSGFDADYFGDATDIPERIQQDEEQRLPAFRIVMLAGAGMRYNLSERLAVHAELTYRFPFTDYLDGFSKAANPGQKDHYHSVSAGAVYRTGKKSSVACPVIKY
ncbi:MAG: porin family protein [Bacteroidetes bacterium]|nr:porin family protein [Bacteroidota bacterium]